MTYGPDPGRGRVDLAGIGLCIVDEGRNRFGWKRWIGQHGLRLPSDTRHARDVADEIEIELSVACGVDCVSRTDQKERIAVRGLFTTTWVAILVAAPGLFSMTNGWPRRADSHCPINRPMMSYPPPAAKPTIIRTGRVG